MEPRGAGRVRRVDAEFEAFFRAMLPKAIAVAERVAGDRAAAEDAAVQALAKAHVRWTRLCDQPWREAWVLRVTVNEAIDALPRRLALPPAAHLADLADAVSLRLTLRAALRSLPRRQREAIALRYLVGLSEADVARALDVSASTVKTHLRRGLDVLRREVKTPMEEERLARIT